MSSYDEDTWDGDTYGDETEPEEEHNDEDDGMDEESAQENQATLEDCLKDFGSSDYIMEPSIFMQLPRYFKAGGTPEQVVELLSDNYKAVAQMGNLLAEWLILSGVELKDVQKVVEGHLQEMIIKHFDPKKADSIFSDEGETPSWLSEMIDHATWRSLFYKLAEQHPDCLMLNFTIKLISDAGYQGEITTVSTACHQIEVFSRVLRTCITTFLSGNDEVLSKNLPEFTKMVCHGEHTYLYSQLVMHILSQEPKGGAKIRRICQELENCAKERDLNVTPISMAVSGATTYPRACQALRSMMSRGALNPADITQLHKMYVTSDPPPVDLIRYPHFIELFVEVLFKPGAKMNPEHKPKYIYLMAYSASVTESWKKNVRRSINKDELKSTITALEKAHVLCTSNKGVSELIPDVTTLFQVLKVPIVALGILKWIDYTVSEPSYFKLNTDHTPLHLVLLDEVSSNHILLHNRILDLLISLFTKSYDELDVLVRIELKKTVLDRMIHLLSRGCVTPVVSYVKQCWIKQETDISLIRHFVTEILDVIAPPYTKEFIDLFLPLVENEEITGSLRNEEKDDIISSFIVNARLNYIAVS